MCGIGGSVSWVLPPDVVFSERLSMLLSHRGPDGHGSWKDGNACFIHRRLSIIDLSNRGAQPMRDELGSLTITFNGEIYNYRELRDELIALGHSFRSNSDTEVVLKAHLEWGDEAPRKFHGMFAYALWSDDASLILVRDRLGKKPLYYHWDGKQFHFSSELMPLVESLPAPRPFNERALNKFLAFGYISGEETAYQGIYKAPPATILKINNGRISRINYWDLAQAFKNKNVASYEQCKEEFKDVFTRAVKRRLVADVPVGVALSGGHDSNLVALLASREVSDLHSFTIRFDQKEYDESTIARQSAKLFGISNSMATFSMSGVDFNDVFRRSDWVADTSFLATSQLFQLARGSRKVLLTGDGGDEILGGYPTYKADGVYNRLKGPMSLVPEGLRETVADLLLSTSRGIDWRFKARQFLVGAQGAGWKAHASWRTFFTLRDRAQILQSAGIQVLPDEDLLSEEKELYSEVSDIEPMEQHFYVDLRTWLLDDVLVKVDRASMLHGVEARSPFLDHELVEFVCGLPLKYKWDMNGGKKILRDTFRTSLPESVLKGGKKGFNVPVRKQVHSKYPGDFLPYLHIGWEFYLRGAR